MKRLFSICISFLLIYIGCIYAQPHISTQAHQSAITTLTVPDSSGAFYSAGKDGFLTKWTPIYGQGEHYQLTDLEIRMVAVHPNGTDVAVYETDGYTLHRISVWNWKTQTRKYAKRFNTTITYLNYTAKGSYLVVGTASVSGTYFFESSMGRQVKKIKEGTGIISLFITGQTEKSSVTYSPSGLLTYYNMSSGTQKNSFTAESGLSQLTFFNNNLFLAGVKNNSIYITDALTGTVLSRVSAKNPILIPSPADTGLYYIETENRSFLIKQIQNDNNLSVAGPVTIRTFTGPQSNSIVAAVKSDNNIIAGTADGHLFSISIDPLYLTAEAQKITENRYQKIYDAASYGEEFYFLTKDTVYSSSYTTGAVSKVTENANYTNFTVYKDTIIFWSKGTRQSIKQVSPTTNAAKVLFTPRNDIQTLQIYNDTLVYIEGSSTVNIYDMNTGSQTEIYRGTGIQDAVLYNNQMIIAKSAASEPKSPLISVDLTTKETVMLPVSGDVAYSLSYDPAVTNAPVYFINISVEGNSKKTAVGAYYPTRRSMNQILQLADEDTNAFIYLYGTTLYTNMGKTQVRSYNVQSRRESQLNRSASLPLKITRNRTHVVVLNRDGSISWYKQGNGTILADWYLTTGGQWFEF